MLSGEISPPKSLMWETSPSAGEIRKGQCVVPYNFRELSDPPPTYRPAPFWAIDDKLEPEEIRRQVREMREQGFGGGFFHSRVGLLTPYLSDEWFEAFGASLQQGRQNGFLTWMYDEDLWPSGFAGGLVLDRDPEYAERYLRTAPAEATLSDRSRPLACFALEFDANARLTSYERLSDTNQKGRQYVFYEELMAPTNRFGAQPYADLANAEAVRAFIELTYDPYREHFGADLGGLIPGCFTDEPAVHNRPESCAWSKHLLAAFKERCGYDLEDHLPLLFLDHARSAKVRYDYRRTLNLLFVESFSKQIYEWCEEAGIALTGHYLAEDTLESQLCTGGATMPHYEYQQMPGIDFLRLRHDHELTLKQVSSGARQFGRTQVLSELFGVTGHQCTFEDQKWIGDYHLVMGVTFFCQHLFLYSMRGERKRDYPPTISYQNAYWPYYGRLNDYFSRLGYALSQGAAVADILLLHPIGSAYVAFAPGHGQPELPVPDNAALKQLDADLLQLLQSLMQLHRDFDLGDEEIMERHGAVEGDTLRVRTMQYRVVIVPPSITWRSATLSLLKRFADVGHIIFVSPTPTLVDAEASDEYEALLAHDNVTVVGNDKDELEAALAGVHQRDISLADSAGSELPTLLYTHRVVNAKDVYFVVNTSRTDTVRAKATLRGSGDVVVYDAILDEQRVLPSERSGDSAVCELVLPPVGSCLLMVGADAARLPEHKWPEEADQAVALPDTWQHERLGPNSMTLDMATVEAEGIDATERVVYRIRRDLHRQCGFQDLVGLQPWRVLTTGAQTDSGKQVKLRFAFESRIGGAGRDIAVVVEDGMGDSLSVNGQPVSMDTNEWQWDVHFRKIPIGEHIEAGTNVIEITYDSYDFLDMVEEIYLVGDFGVEMVTSEKAVLIEEPQHLRSGDWVEQGYPFFAGRMLYRQSFERPAGARMRTRLALTNPSGSCFAVRVNGVECGFLASEPWHVEITDALKTGTNEIEIEVVSTLRNTFGPLHLKEHIPWVGPGEFVNDANWEPTYHFHPYGLLGGTVVEVTEK